MPARCSDRRAPRARDAPRRHSPVPRSSRDPASSVCPSQLPDAHAKLPPFSRAIPQVASILFVVGVVFIPLGVVCMMANARVVEVSRRYDNEPACEAEFFATSEERATMCQTDGRGVQCSVNVMVPQTMKAPVFVYYTATTSTRTTADTSNPEATISSAANPSPARRARPSSSGSTRQSARNMTTINPCGPMAWSYFNDT